jgi:mRNA interferase MazF
MKRGEIWYVDLGEPKGSAPAFERPVVIVQDDLLTDSRLSTVMVAPITSNLQRALAVGNVRLDTKTSGLKKDSVILVCQVMTIDKSLFDKRIGTLPKRQIQDLDSGLRLVLSLKR